MSRILHIETATHTCSVALSYGEMLISIRESHIDKSHASLLTVFIEDLFQETGIPAAELDAVSVSMGPGSYTGLRIGVSVAKGLAYSLGIPMLAVSTLKAMALGFLKRLEAEKNEDHTFLLCPMIDARRMEVYLAMYDSKLETVKDTTALIIDKNSFLEKLERRRMFFFGSGAQKCESLINHKNSFFNSEFLNSSKYMIPLALSQFKKKEFVDLAYFEPYYLKDFIATTPKNKILGSI